MTSSRQPRRAPGSGKRHSPLMEVTCRCGWTVRGSESEVIAPLQAHAKGDHGLDVTADDIRVGGLDQ
jgi:hypothetical protein